MRLDQRPQDSEQHHGVARVPGEASVDDRRGGGAAGPALERQVVLVAEPDAYGDAGADEDGGDEPVLLRDQPCGADGNEDAGRDPGALEPSRRLTALDRAPKRQEGVV